MKNKKSLFFSIVLTTLLLVSCKGAVITREEAAARAANIEEHCSSDDFEFPTKFSMTQDVKMVLFETQVDVNMVETLDLGAKYYYVSVDGTAGEESEHTKTWVYYQAKDNKSYMVSDDNGTKSHTYMEGDIFADFDVTVATELGDLYSDIGISDLLLPVEEDDARNVYRSSGEGSIYLKIYLVEENENAYTEIEISKYLISRIYTFIDETTEIEMKIKYSGISTSKPNLADYPLAAD